MKTFQFGVALLLGGGMSLFVAGGTRAQDVPVYASPQSAPSPQGGYGSGQGSGQGGPGSPQQDASNPANVPPPPEQGAPGAAPAPPMPETVPAPPVATPPADPAGANPAPAPSGETPAPAPRGTAIPPAATSPPTPSGSIPPASSGATVGPVPTGSQGTYDHSAIARVSSVSGAFARPWPALIPTQHPQSNPMPSAWATPAKRWVYYAQYSAWAYGYERPDGRWELDQDSWRR